MGGYVGGWVDILLQGLMGGCVSVEFGQGFRLVGVC